MKKSRRVVAGLLVMAMAAVLVPSVSEVKATDLSVFYEAGDMKTNWDNNKKAPTKKDYVFGGWFKLESDGTTYTALKETDIDTNGDGVADMPEEETECGVFGSQHHCSQCNRLSDGKSGCRTSGNHGVRRLHPVLVPSHSAEATEPIR